MVFPGKIQIILGLFFFAQLLLPRQKKFTCAILSAFQLLRNYLKRTVGMSLSTPGMDSL